MTLSQPAILPGAVAADELAAAPAVRADEPAPRWLERGRIPCLDGLRALSIALVFIEHSIVSSGHLPAGHWRAVVGHLGGIGVDVFFAISGFLITLLLLRESRRTGTISLKGFYIRRFLRLMPAAIAFLTVVFVLFMMGTIPMSGRNWLHVMTYTVNFDPHPRWEVGHLWSLSIEEQFYFLWPLTLLLLGAGRARVLAVVWLLAAPVVRFVMLRMHPHDMGRFDTWTHIRVDCIAAGCLLALVAGDPSFRRLTRTTPAVAMTLIAMAVVGLFVNVLIGDRIALWGVTVGHSVRAACIVTLIWLSINHFGSRWGRVLDSRPFVAVGILSYSLYLWQQIFLVPNAHQWVRTLPWAVIAAVACATASYLLIERPFLKLKDRFER